MLLSEIPFDFLSYGGFTWAHQSVMVTLLIGLTMLLMLEKLPHPVFKIAMVIPFALFAELCNCDYGGMGIAMIALFYLTRELPYSVGIQFVGLLALSWLAPMRYVTPLGIRFPLEGFCVFALVPIFLYSGKKLLRGNLQQWSFYLFYPGHLALLWLICTLLR